MNYKILMVDDDMEVIASTIFLSFAIFISSIFVFTYSRNLSVPDFAR